MKKILLVTLMILIITGCNNNSTQNKDSEYVMDYTLEVDKTDNCDSRTKEYYSDGNSIVYLVCLDELYLKLNSGKVITLDIHFENVNQSLERSIEQLVGDMENVATLRDGGTKVYKKNNYTIIVCNTTEGNKDVYIGQENLKYQENYCKQI